jgi:nitroreductase
VIPVAVIPIGYPEGEPRITPRNELEEITHIDKY